MTEQINLKSSSSRKSLADMPAEDLRLQAITMTNCEVAFRSLAQLDVSASRKAELNRKADGAGAIADELTVAFLKKKEKI